MARTCGPVRVETENWLSAANVYLASTIRTMNHTTMAIPKAAGDLVMYWNALAENARIHQRQDAVST